MLRRLRAISALAFLLVAAVAHAGASTSDYEVVDDTGVTLRFAVAPQRIVSLAPGATEMLFAIGAGARVVGTSRYSDQPAAARAVPRVGDVASIDLERILAMRPDVVVVWQGGNPAVQLEQLTKLKLKLYRQHVTALRDLPQSLRRLGALVGVAQAAERAAQELTDRLTDLQKTYRSRPRVTVFLQIWNRPLYTVGGRHMMSDALRVCGADTIFPELTGEAPAVSIEAVLRRNPDVIVADAPPGQARSWLEDWRRFGSLAAVRRGALVPFEDARFGMLGPSALDATATLCASIDRWRSGKAH